MKSTFIFAFIAICYGAVIKRQATAENTVASTIDIVAVILPTAISNGSDTYSFEAPVPPVRDDRPILVDSENETQAPEQSYTLEFDPIILRTPISDNLDAVDEEIPSEAEPTYVEDTIPVSPSNDAVLEDWVVDYASIPVDTTDSDLKKRGVYDVASDAEINAFLMDALSKNPQLKSYLKDMDSFSTADYSESGN